VARSLVVGPEGEFGAFGRAAEEEVPQYSSFGVSSSMTVVNPSASLGTEMATFLTSLELTNFRSFESALFRFPKRLTVVFGKNGSGKSSIVDAIAMILTGEFLNAGVPGGVFPLPSDTRRIAKSFGEQTVYEPAPSRKIEARGHFGFGEGFVIAQQVPTEANESDYGRVGNGIRRQLQSSEETNLHLFAVFRAKREYHDSKADFSTLPVGRADGYTACLDLARSSDTLRSWFKRQVLKRGRTGVASGEAQTVLEALRVAIPNLLNVDYDADLADLVVNFGEGEVPFGSLSDGQRGFFGMVAEIAIRCTQLNPHLNGEAIRKTEGLVLVDEIDLHLHPEWQREIVRSLIATFPGLQFVLTTHSPIVLTEVERLSVIDLDRPADQFVPELSSFGKDSGWVTRHLMDAPTRPSWAASEFTKIENAVDNGDDDEARRLIQLMKERLDDLDPDLIRWEAFVGEAAE
jgi:predicted ATP-binding protein involved in virulence